MIYKHKFKDGQIVRDTEYNETFKFKDRMDGFIAQENPTKLRLATQEEAEQLINTQKQ